MNENQDNNTIVEFVDAVGVLNNNDNNLAVNGGTLKTVEKTGRKSVGRRVSFAATAKVRLFEKGDGSEHSKQPSKQNELASESEDDNLDEDKMAASIAPETHVMRSPVRAPGTPTSRLPQVLSPSSADQPTLLPSKIPVKSPLSMQGSNKSPANSFEVDIEEEEEESLSSFMEEEEEDNQMEDATMEFTTCVGGFAPTTAYQRLSEANTMDFTGCVGKILSDIADPNKQKYDELENDTMDLTTCIGGLLEDQSHNDNIHNQSHGGKVGDDNMELTQVVHGNIQQSPMHPVVAALKMTSPSPFLVHSPLTPKKRHSLLSSDVPFIDSIDRPDFANMASPMAIDDDWERHKEKVKQKEEQVKQKEEQVKNLKKGNVRFEAKPSSQIERVEREEEELFKAIINTEPTTTTATITTATAAINSQSNNSQLTLDVKEFLAKAGIRFMDNLTNLTRRETTVRPRDSSRVITPSRHRILLASTLPEQQAVDSRCAAMINRITGVRQEIQEAELKFAHSTAIIRQQEQEDQEQVRQKMKTAKSVARLAARCEWYQWRAEMEAPLNACLNSNLQSLKQQSFMTTQKEVDIDAVGVPLVRLRDKLSSQLYQLECQERARTSIDWEQVSNLQAMCSEYSALSSQLDQEMATLAKQEEELRKKLSSIQEDKRVMTKSIDGLQEERQQLSECSVLALKELKSRMALLEALHGWHLVSLKASFMVIEWCRGGSRVQAKLELQADVEGGGGRRVIVPAVQLSIVQSNSFMKHAVGIVRVEAGRGLLCTLISLLSQLDRLHHIDRAVIRGRMIANVLISDTEPTISCTFLHPGLSKYTVIVRVTVDRLELVQAGAEYGDGLHLEQHARNAIDAANLGSRFSQLDTFLEQLKNDQIAN